MKSRYKKKRRWYIFDHFQSQMAPLDVSVVIPTYNRASCILRAVQSVLNQNDVSFELIIIDDGSTDQTQELIAPFLNSDPRIQYFFKSNEGPSSARNLGIKKSKAPFIAFLDSDDEWLPGKLKNQIDFLNHQRDLLICQTDEIWIRNGKRVNPMKKHKKFGGDIFEKCLPLSIVSPSCVMMRKEFFDQIGLFDESLPACEDYDLWLRASARFPIGFIEKNFVIKYGGHSDQRSREFLVMDRFRIQALVKLLESGISSESKRQSVVSELSKKCEIVQNGSLKRGKIEEAEYYRVIARRFEEPTKPASPAGGQSDTKCHPRML